VKDFYKWQEGTKNACENVANTACHKLVTDMWYETRISAIIQYWANNGRRVRKAEARTLKLTMAQFNSVNMQHLIL